MVCGVCQRALTAVLSVNDYYYFDGSEDVAGRCEVITQ